MRAGLMLGKALAAATVELLGSTVPRYFYSKVNREFFTPYLPLFHLRKK